MNIKKTDIAKSCTYREVMVGNYRQRTGGTRHKDKKKSYYIQVLHILIEMANTKIDGQLSKRIDNMFHKWRSS